MKLLLTSNGITNKTIENKLRELVGKDFSELKAAFIPTAIHPGLGDKSWFIENINNIHKLGFKEFDIVDISTLNKNEWLSRLESVDIIFCNGGSNFFLTKWIKLSGLSQEILRLLETRVWVGSSSGSMVMSPYQSVKISQEIYEEDFNETEDKKSLEFIEFYIVPHLNGDGFPKLTEKNLKNILKDFKQKVYVLDDNSAIAVVDGKVEIVSEGNWFEIN